MSWTWLVNSNANVATSGVIDITHSFNAKGSCALWLSSTSLVDQIRKVATLGLNGIMNRGSDWEATDQWRATVDFDLSVVVNYNFKGNTGIRIWRTSLPLTSTTEAHKAGVLIHDTKRRWYGASDTHKHGPLAWSASSGPGQVTSQRQGGAPNGGEFSLHLH